jgi:glycosyltransferase 2 family protein
VNRSMWARAHVLGGLTIVGVVGWRLGTGPFLDGLHAVDLRSITLAAVITCVTTTACAWRWQVVALSLGVDLSLSRAIAAYYRSQFLNTVLPGGVLGDVHRGVDHGQATGDLSRALRAVAWERMAGQIVQLIIAVLVLAVLPSPVRSELPLFLACTAVGALLVAGAVRFRSRSSLSRTAHAGSVAASDVRHGLLARRAWPAITAASLLVVVGHVSVFVIAAHAVDAHASLRVLMPLALLVLVSAALPTNIGGWGPREGAAAWVFASAGLGADHGVATATAFGVLMLTATLPGGVLVAGIVRRRAASVPASSIDCDLVGIRNG